MKRTITTIFFCLALGVAASAQTPKPEPTKPKPEPPPAATPAATPAAAAQALPTVDQILDKYVQAVGGKAALNKFNSRVSKGTVEIPAANLSGTMELYEKAPNKSAATITLPGFGQMQQAYDGTAGWSRDPQSGLRDLKDAELTIATRESDFFKTLNLKTHYPKMAVKGKEKLGGREVYVLEATPTSGHPEKMYFDAQSGLLVRNDVERDGPQGRVTVTNEFEDYKDVDGIKLPMTTRQLFPSFTMVMRFTEVKHNEAIDDAKFAKPAPPKTEP